MTMMVVVVVVVVVVVALMLLFAFVRENLNYAQVEIKKTLITVC